MNLDAQGWCPQRGECNYKSSKKLRLDAYDSACGTRKRRRCGMTRTFARRELKVGQRVLLFQSRLKTNAREKLRSRWIGPYTIVAIRANGAVELQGSDPGSPTFMVNGHG
ncbi:uncharacterized protein LOC121810613 [Salvia splendens]|uniref:uncharacterized protein LOC121810613 n=1 Tax=Salvia splendens TaxID=180675 RepID=UPI001C2653D9|nr:uncharacterized protein LOC121810613 [Salvia splendens]